jgi:hypothetical protein
MPSITLCFVLATMKKNLAEIRLAEEIRREHSSLILTSFGQTLLNIVIFKK